MSTRAVYTFKDDIGAFHVYRHLDGYPEGAIDFIKAAFEAESPRCTAADLAVSFIVANKRPQSLTILTPHYDEYRNLDYRYEITKNESKNEWDMFFEVKKGNFVVSAFKRTSVLGDDPTYDVIFSGTLDEFEEFAEKNPYKLKYKESVHINGLHIKQQFIHLLIIKELRS